MGTNPAVSLPRAGAMREACKRLELLVVSENVASNDTLNSGAHILLPAAAWGEKDGTVTNSERRVSRQRAFLPLPGEARPDWWTVTQVASRMGFEKAFNFNSPVEVFREHAALSAFENDGTRDFDLGALARIKHDAFEALDPIVWPAREAQVIEGTRFFADGTGGAEGTAGRGRHATGTPFRRNQTFGPKARAATAASGCPHRAPANRCRAS